MTFYFKVIQEIRDLFLIYALEYKKFDTKYIKNFITM